MKFRNQNATIQEDKKRLRNEGGNLGKFLDCLEKDLDNLIDELKSLLGEESLFTKEKFIAAINNLLPWLINDIPPNEIIDPRTKSSKPATPEEILTACWFEKIILYIILKEDSDFYYNVDAIHDKINLLAQKALSSARFHVKWLKGLHYDIN